MKGEVNALKSHHTGIEISLQAALAIDVNDLKSHHTGIEIISSQQG